jgi:hypothetical protein
LKLLNDAALSDAARILGFYLSTLPAGPHEMPYAELSVLLHNTPNRATVGKHLRQLCARGYARLVSSGGSGSPCYEWLDSECNKVNADDALRAEKRTQDAPHVVVVVEDRKIPPIVPLKPLAPDAEALIEAERERLGECVKPLMSYLRRRVPPDRQEPYAGRVVGALKPETLNPQWKDATGQAIPMPRRRAIMADALNELATVDEVKGRAHGEGDWNNLRNKINNLCKFENAPPLQSTGTDGYRSRAGPRGKAPADQNDYGEGTQHWPGKEGFNG